MKHHQTFRAMLRGRGGACTGVFTAVLFLALAPSRADVTSVKIAKDETSSGSNRVRHITGVISGTALRNEAVPTLEKCAGLKYETDFELWVPADNFNGRFWFNVLNRGGDAGSIRTAVLGRGGAYGWCAWQAVNVKPPKPQLKLSGFEGPTPQAYGMVVVRDFVAFLRYAKGEEAAPNPVAGKVRFAFCNGVSQSGRFMRTFLVSGLNASPSGKAFDGFLPNGARAGYLDLFRANSDPGSGGTFSAETVHAPYSWSELMSADPTGAKVMALNAESEYFQMMAYMSRRGSIPDNVRVYDFPLGGHGGGGTVAWGQCIVPLSAALEAWACDGKTPPQSRLFTLEKRDNPRVKHLAGESVECPVADDLGIAVGGLRLPEVAAPTARYLPLDNGSYKREPLGKDEMKLRYGTPENYRKKVAEAVRELIREGFLPESSRGKYVGEAEKVNW
jgi:hypothetical protein